MILLAQQKASYRIFNLWWKPARFWCSFRFCSQLYMRSNDIFPLGEKRSSAEDLVLLAQKKFPFEPWIWCWHLAFISQIFKTFMINHDHLRLYVLWRHGFFHDTFFKSKRNKEELLRRVCKDQIPQKKKTPQKQQKKNPISFISNLIRKRPYKKFKSMSDEETWKLFPKLRSVMQVKTL